jgi:hypothetical protein
MNLDHGQNLELQFKQRVSHHQVTTNFLLFFNAF